MRGLCCILFIAVLVVSVTSQSAISCPDNCDCNQLESVGLVSCDSRVGIPQDLPTNVKELEVRKSEFNSILLKVEVSKLKKHQDLFHLALSECGLHGIEREAFSELTNLTYLDLSYNQLSVLFMDQLQGLENLRELHLLSSGIQQISAPLNLPSLVKLDLEKNSLTTISDSAFQYLTNLENLYLADNKLQEISPTAFDNLAKLKHLSLFGNELTIPHQQWFASIKNNSGTTKMISRSSNSSHPEKINPWKCCEDMKDFIHFIKYNFAQNEKTFVCHWPPHLTNRLMTSLENGDIDGLSCTKTPTPTPSTIGDRKSNGSDDGTTSSVGDLSGSISVVAIVEDKDARMARQNFLSELDNGLVSLVILLFGLLFAFLAVSIYHCKCASGKSDDKSRIFFPCSPSSCSDVEIPQKQPPQPAATERSTIPFKQDHPSYGIASHSIDMMRANGMKPRESNASSVVSGGNFDVGSKNGDLYSQINRTLYLNDTDQSEDEIWDIKTQQKFKA